MNKLDVQIRQADIFDIESLISLLKVLFSIEEDFVFNEEKQKSGLMLMLEDDERACVLVAEAGGEVVGMCSGQLTISTAEGGPSLLVEDMVVRDDFSRQGIGRALMERIALWGQAKGASRLQLLADRNNLPALKFYKRLGWQSTELICMRKLISIHRF